LAMEFQISSNAVICCEVDLVIRLLSPVGRSFAGHAVSTFELDLIVTVIGKMARRSGGRRLLGSMVRGPLAKLTHGRASARTAVAAVVADEALDAPLVIALARTVTAVPDQVVRQEPR
jgi:hypothetical protein